MSATAHADADGPLTVVVTRRIRKGSEAAADQWMKKAIDAASRFDGHLGASVMRHPPNTSILFRFATVEHLAVWEASDERARLLAEVAPITTDVKVQRLGGLEPFFVLPGAPAVAPPRWKMAVVTWAVAFPTIQLLQATLGRWLGRLPDLARGAAVGAAMVAAMTWFTMPWATRALRRWLFR